MKQDEPAEWIPKDAFVMPVLPPDLSIDPSLAALLHLASLLELSGDEAVDPDWAIEALEHMAYYLGLLPTSEFERFQSQLDRIADYGERQSWPEDFTNFARELLRSSSLGEED
jgi:hypothetical protein